MVVLSLLNSQKNPGGVDGQRIVADINAATRARLRRDDLAFDAGVLDEIQKYGDAVSDFGVDILFKNKDSQGISSPFDFDAVSQGSGIFKIKNINYQPNPAKQAAAGLLCGPAVYGVLRAKDDPKLRAKYDHSGNELFNVQRGLVALIEKFFMPFTVFFSTATLKDACAVMNSRTRPIGFLRKAGFEDIALALESGSKKSLMSLFVDRDASARAKANFARNGGKITQGIKGFGKTIYPRAEQRAINGSFNVKGASRGNCIGGDYVGKAISSGKYFKAHVVKPKYKTVAEKNFFRSSTGSADRLRKQLKGAGMNAKRTTRLVCKPTQYGIAPWNPTQYGKTVSTRSGKLALLNKARKQGLGPQLEARGQQERKRAEDIGLDVFRPIDTFPDLNSAKYQKRLAMGTQGQYKINRSGVLSKDIRARATRAAPGKGEKLGKILAKGAVLRSKGSAYQGRAAGLGAASSGYNKPVKRASQAGLQAWANARAGIAARGLPAPPRKNQDVMEEF